MKIRYSLSDGKILQLGSSTLGDDKHHIDYDPSTEGIICFPTDQTVQSNQWKYKIDNNQLMKLPEYHLVLTTTSTDSDHDGLIDIPANGSSICTITIQKKNENNSNASGDDEIWISATRGSLNKLHGNLSNGSLNFTLTSANETVLSNIYVSTKNLLVKDAFMQIQFRPV